MPKTENLITLIVTASVAAFKSLELLRLFQKQGFKVQVLITKSAKEFVTPLSFESLGAKLIKDELFDSDYEKSMGHIQISRESEFIVIYPATADFIARIAQGRSDSLSTAIVLASNKKIFLAPAMNKEMWAKKTTQDNLSKLRENNIEILEPIAGELACGEEGVGKLKEVEDSFKQIISYQENNNLLKGKNILVTAGGTQEKIDPVRFIGNFSSGKQGIAFAKKCQDFGANVTLILANVEELPKGINFKQAKSAGEIYDIVIEEITKTKFDIAIMSAAISDYTIAMENEKIKKGDKDSLELKLTKTKDILKEVATHKNRPKTLIGFAAETKDLEKNAITKLKEKNLDYIIANNVSEGKIFGQENTEVTLIAKNVSKSNFSGPKSKVSEEIIKVVIK